MLNNVSFAIKNSNNVNDISNIYSFSDLLRHKIVRRIIKKLVESLRKKSSEII